MTQTHTAHAAKVLSAQRLLAHVEAGGDAEDFTINPTTGTLEPRWLSIHCDSPGEAIDRAVRTTGNFDVSLSGDFGQGTDTDGGIGNDDFSIVFHGNGSATLCIRYTDNKRYLSGQPPAPKVG